jgi:hypothetical protein
MVLDFDSFTDVDTVESFPVTSSSLDLISTSAYLSSVVSTFGSTLGSYRSSNNLLTFF